MNRRTVIRGLLAAGAFGASSRLWIGCTPTSNIATNPNPTPSSKPLEIGFIYVGPKDDYGYNQSHAEGKATVDKLSGVKIVEEASVPETTAAEETMTNMIKQDGATVLFPTSYGYFNPHSLKIAREFPEVQLFHPNQPYKDEYPKNVGSYFSDLVEPAYLAGIVAALTSKTGKLGFIIPKPIPVVLREANSFALGAQSVKPNIVVQAIVTGDWSLPVKEAEAANSLLDQGADVLTGRVDNMKVIITTAEKRGAFSSGYHINQASLAPKGYLTGVEWNWGKIYSTYVEMVKAGKTLMNGGIPHVVAGGLKEDFCKLSPFGASVSAETKKAVEAAKAKLLDGSLAIFKGELKDNKGNVVIPSGKTYSLQDPQLQKMDWLVEGILGDAGTK
ncbi:BMP family ABC transporter substrate-binding protein [Leptolyngbya boryana CZ1]|uniref:BMP family ABC transporter substrate-binding protein n=1 Tax=Leptolyngbya boryana CZ1 TaxID=3060204 RepID=A0AA97AVB2_LEPBY|nr:BMP family ABC transporter substrate-binding protein [Leptolyngbya boryana]WNZ45146.1 BMP family ABC transporter substrate-binding protein [Leptolyngbya boryana CZ1]